MHFKYVIFSISALLIQVINGQNAGSSFGCSCCCDTSIPSPVSFRCTQELGSLSGNNAGLSDSITSCGIQSEKSNSTAAARTGEDVSSCDSAADRYRRATHSNDGNDGLRCTTNLLKARLALAAATAKAAASNAQEDALVVAKSVPVPAELTPPRLLHRQGTIGLSLSPCLINVPAPSCNCSSFVPSGSIAHAVTISQKLGNPNGNNAASISNCRCTDLPRPLPPKPPSVENCTTPIRVPDADRGQTSILAAIVTARLALHRLLTGQQPNSPVNLPASCCDSSSFRSRNNVNAVAIPSNGDFLVTSISSEPPPSIVVETDVALSGNLNVCGNLPFVSAVQFDGSYDTMGSGSVSFGCDSESSNNAVSGTSTIDSCRSPDVPRASSTLAAAAIGASVTQAEIPCADDELQSFPSINPADALFARLVQQRSLTSQQSNIEQCPYCIKPSIPNCSSSSIGSISSVITPDSGSLCVTSVSSESPGLAVDTDVGLSGNLDVCGALPFASAVQFQGLYDTSGSGSVSFGCDSKPEQTLENLNGNNAARKPINSCRSSQPKYIPRALPTLTTVATEVGDLPTKVDADEGQISATNMAALVSARLAQHRLLTGKTPDCECRSSVSPNFFTPSNGGVPVTSISPKPPGVDVDANIGLFGNLNVSGDLPFQSAVQFQGLYETSGSGKVSFGCGHHHTESE